jgi:pimeloyl-ACP methyl ester carboxylesterase
MPTLLLIHGGLWEDVGADWFWRRPGIVAGLERLGFTMVAPDRLRRPASWAAHAGHVLASVPGGPVTVMGGSFGCSVAVRLALDSPGRVSRMVLAWPASLSDQFAAILVFRRGLRRAARDTTPRGAPRPVSRQRA